MEVRILTLRDRKSMVKYKKQDKDVPVIVLGTIQKIDKLNHRLTTGTAHRNGSNL